METYRSIVIFFNTFPKRKGLLEYIYSVRCRSTETRKILVGLCGTRWSERDISYERFYLAIPFIAEAFEVINGTHPELQTLYKEHATGWDVHVKREVTSFLNALTKFEFIVGIIVLYRLMHPAAGLTNKLQGRNIDIIEAYESATRSIEGMKYVQESIDNEFDQIFKQAERMAIKLDVQQSLPRSVAKQMHRNNVPADTPKEYFKRSLAIPSLDNFIDELEFRFNDLSERSSKLLFLVPAVISEIENPDFSELSDFYRDDLPNKDALNLEINLWR